MFLRKKREVEIAQLAADRLRNNDRTLTYLNLETKRIGTAGIRALANALHNNTALKYLDLRDKRIGNEGAKALAHALEKNTSLTGLNLKGNQIGAEGARALAVALENHTSLSEFYMRDNPIGMEGAKALAGALWKKNSFLTDLDLWETNNSNVDNNVEDPLFNNEDSDNATLSTFGWSSDDDDSVWQEETKSLRRSS